MAFLLDRKTQRPCLVVSKEGGVEIETVAKENPDAIHTYSFDIDTGLTDAILDDVLLKLDLSHNAKDAKE